jgi:Spy/CpxP family protein refolding chaperone
MKRLGKIKTLAISGLAALALATPLAFAQSQGGNHGDKQGAHGSWRERGEQAGGDHFGGGMFRDLNLTDDQKAKLQQIRQSFAAETKPLREQLRAKHQELRQASEGGTFNEALATQKLTEAAAIEAKLMGAEFNLHQQMLSVLTPEQKTQLEQRRAQFKANHGERRGDRQQQ